LEGVDSFLKAVEPGVFGTVPDNMGQYTVRLLLPLLIRAEFKPMADIVTKTCNFSQLFYPVIHNLPHLEDVKTVGTLVQRVVAVDLFVPALQLQGGRPLSKASLGLTLSAHANLATLRMLATKAFVSLIVDDEAANIDGVNQEHLCLVLCLKNTSVSVLDSLSSESHGAIDGENANLIHSVAFCKQWVVGLQFWLKQLVQHYFVRIGECIDTLALTLEKRLPHWTMFISDSEWNPELAQKQILEHEFRSEFSPLTDSLALLLSQLQEAIKVLDADPYLESKSLKQMVGYAETMELSLRHYLLIQGALNAILSWGMESKGVTLAQKIIAFNKSDETKTKLPSPLLVILSRLAEGDRTTLPELASQVQPKKKKRKFIKDEPAADDKPSQSQIVAACYPVKVEIKEAPADTGGAASSAGGGAAETPNTDSLESQVLCGFPWKVQMLF
jgi:hypothetical protein